MPAANPVALEQTEESLRRRVIATVANGVHATDDAIVARESLILTVGERRPAVGVQDHRASVVSVLVRHQNRVEHQLSVLP
mgnify:CR=1 FL=1